MVVDGEEPEEILAWGREMLRNYRPDHITTSDDRWRYVGLVRTDIRYGSQDNKYDRDRDFLATTQARALGEPYLQVKRAHWVGELMDERRTWAS